MGIIKGHTDWLYRDEAQVKYPYDISSSCTIARNLKAVQYIVYLTCLIFSFYLEVMWHSGFLFTVATHARSQRSYCHSTSVKTSICSPYLSCNINWPVLTYTRFKLTVQLFTWWGVYMLYTHKIRSKLQGSRWDCVVEENKSTNKMSSDASSFCCLELFLLTLIWESLWKWTRGSTAPLWCQ